MLTRWVKCLAVIAGVLGSMAMVPALAAKPEDALSFEPPGLDALIEQASLTDLEYRAQQVGLTGRVGLQLRDSLGPSATLSLWWRYAPDRLLSEAQQAENAWRQVRSARRRGVRDALLAYGALWKAQIALDLAEIRLQEAKAKGGDTRMEELGLEEAKANLKRALETAKLYGLEGEAEPVALRFVVPEVDLEALPAYQRELYALQRAEQGLKKAWSVYMPNVSFWAGVGGPEGRLLLNASTDGPSLGLRASRPGSGSGNWDYGFDVRVSVPLDVSNYVDIRRAELELEQRRARFDEAKARIALTLDAYLDAVRFAEQRLDTIANFVDEAKQALENAEAGGNAALMTAARHKLDVQMDRLVDAWMNYVRRLYVYLDYVDQAWQPLAATTGEPTQGGKK